MIYVVHVSGINTSITPQTSQTSLTDLSIAVETPYGSKHIFRLSMRNHSYAIFEFSSSFSSSSSSVNYLAPREAANFCTKLIYCCQTCASSPSDCSSCIPHLERKYLSALMNNKRHHCDSVPWLLRPHVRGLSCIIDCV